MIKPLLDIFCIEEKSCDYPVAVKITMEDGSILTYCLENKTDLQFQKVMDSIHRMAEMTVGYQYNPTRKNRIRRGRR